MAWQESLYSGKATRKADIIPPNTRHLAQRLIDCERIWDLKWQAGSWHPA
ncbi:Uncharacterised protein [Klebsiella pneumoniae]|nr:Uncharacterised protein [Klebsiella pneumoniae]